MKKYSQFLKELPSKTVVFAFGRFNPPTTGHELLVKAVKKLAVANKADHAIYASKSQDAKKNPLTVEKKVQYLNLMFPNTHFVAANPNERTFIEAAKMLNKKYKNLIMVAGSDRITEYQKILQTYNGKEFNYDTIQVISAGERDPDADDASGMSASKMRAVASKGDYAQFKKGLPSTMREIDGRRLMNDVRHGMGLDPIKEQLNLVKDELREQYFRGEIFNIGDVVESSGVQYEIVKRGSNHLLLKEQSGKLVSKWIQDVTICEDIKPGYTPDEIKFGGYTTKNLHHSEDAAKAFLDTIARHGKNKPAAVLHALMATDTYMGLSDLHLNQGKAPTETEKDQWIQAHDHAKEHLDELGDFLHHRDYWDNHMHEMEDVLSQYKEEGQGEMNEELTDKTLKSQDKIKVARIIATMLGIENAESSSNPEQLVNLALRKVRTKTFTADSIRILQQMLNLATEVGIKYDESLKPQKLKEGVKQVNGDDSIPVATDSPVVNTKSTYNLAKDRLRYKDFQKLNAAAKGIAEATVDKIKQAGDEDEDDTNAVDQHDADVQFDTSVEEPHRTVGHLMVQPYEKDDNLRRRKVKYHLGEESEQLDEISSKLAGNYYGKVVQQHLKKVGGVRHNMYDRMEKDLGAKRKQGVDRALDRVTGARKTNEEIELDEANFADTMKKAIAAHERGDHTRAKYHLDNAKTARYAMKSTEISKHKDLLDKYAELRKLHEETNLTESTPYWKKSSWIKKMSQAAKQERLAREKKEAEQKKQVKEELEEAVDMASLRQKLNKHSEAAVAANRAGDDEKVKHHQVQMNKIKERMAKLVREETDAICPVCNQPEDKCECDSKDIVRDDDEQLGAKNSNGFDAFFEEDGTAVDMSAYDLHNDEDEITDEELDRMVDSVEDMEDIIDAYDDEELAIVDDETGEEVKDEEEKYVNEQALNEVLSRIERMRAKVRLKRTQGVRTRKMKIALRTSSSTGKINKRARRLAVKLMKKRLLRGRDPAKISVGEKERIERVIQKRKNIVGRLALKLAPRVRSIEKARLSHKAFTKTPTPSVGM